VLARGGSQFSKSRLETLSDGLFAIMMTLLVLELKPPAVAKGAPSTEILRALRHDALPLIGFFLSFILSAQYWFLQHALFHYVRQANRVLAMMTILLLLFVSLLPFSTQMLTHFGLREPVGLVWYFGNQWILAFILAITWLTAKRNGILSGDDSDVERRQFELMIYALPVTLLIPIAVTFISPRQATTSLSISLVLATVFARKRAKATATA
jgi:uncharacterized membrane protein